jgi:hypothetical protein
VTAIKAAIPSAPPVPVRELPASGMQPCRHRNAIVECEPVHRERARWAAIQTCPRTSPGGHVVHLEDGSDVDPE